MIDVNILKIIENFIPCLVTIFILIFIYFWTKNWNYFSKNNVKFIRGIPFLGANYKCYLGVETIVQSYLNVYRKYPNEKIVGIYDLGGVPYYYIRDPDLIRQITIKDFDYFANHLINVNKESDPFASNSLFALRDQEWKEMRAALTPAFTGSKLKLLVSLVYEIVHNFCDELKHQIKDKAVECDMKDLMQRCVNDIIASCAFGITINSLKDKNNEFFKAGHKVAQTDLKFFLYTVCPSIMNGLKIRTVDAKTANYFRGIIKKNIEFRKKNNIIRPDMINLLLENQKRTEDFDENTPNENGEFFTKKWKEEDIVIQAVGFFLGSFITVSKTLCFAGQYLVTHPDILEKLQNEVDEFNKELNGQPISYETLNKMKYMEMVLSEVLRLRFGVIMDRKVTKPYVLETSDCHKIQLNVGDGILITPFSLHRDSKYFPNADVFDPERFNDENKKNVKPGTYLPFGMGPRMCFAPRFGIIKCKLILFYLLAEFKFEKSPKTMDSFILHRNRPEPRNGYWLKLSVRNKK